jgi:hypothetical protein
VGWGGLAVEGVERVGWVGARVCTWLPTQALDELYALVQTVVNFRQVARARERGHSEHYEIVR